MKKLFICSAVFMGVLLTGSLHSASYDPYASQRNHNDYAQITTSNMEAANQGQVQTGSKFTSPAMQNEMKQDMQYSRDQGNMMDGRSYYYNQGGYGGYFGGGNYYSDTQGAGYYGAGDPADGQGSGGACCAAQEECCPSDHDCGECWCLACHYKPCYYYTQRCCEYTVPCQKTCCRYVPQYYQVQKCRMVPQYYCETCCRYVPQYYCVEECKTCYKTVCDKHCKYVPCYYWKHTCGGQTNCYECK